MIQTQEHCLLCKQTNANMNTHIDYSYIYGSLEQPIEVLEEEELTDKDAPSWAQAFTRAVSLTLFCMCIQY